ncbi:MAG: helix-turn-helix domain-containing protein [Candidatus Kariarchaeaceae archaeon]|jgi:DNA-binding transcriptional regulator GbsR (MarR family)
MKIAELIAQLESLDYFPSIYHSRILSALIQSVQPLTAKQLSKKLELADSKIYPTLVELEELGLIHTDISKRPKRYYFDNPQKLQSYLKHQYAMELKNKDDRIKKIVHHANQIWEPDEFELGNIAQIFKGEEIERELVRHLKLAKEQLFLLVSDRAGPYIPLLQQFLELAKSGGAKVEVKQSLWSACSYIVRVRKVMMNLMHSEQDVALITNDDLLVSNIRSCWENTDCCSPKLIELKINHQI